MLQDAGSPLGNRDLYFHYPHYYHAPQTTPCSAVISDNRKLIEYFEDGRTELYDLTNDPAEATDLSSDQPELAEQLRIRLQTWRRSVGAALPAVNPKSKVANSGGVKSGGQRNTGSVQFRRRNDRLEVSVLN
ncbi:MAG: sulfatase/phosphatase domain-containing protein, partial [Phycisphaerae bacterium]